MPYILAERADSAESRFVVVEVIDESAAGFFEKYGLTPIPDTEQSVRLLRRPKSIAA